MNRFAVLLKREWLEWKLPFFWLPVGTLGFIVLASLAALVIWGTAEVEIYLSSDRGDANLFFIDQWSEAELAVRLLAFRSMVAAPFYLVYLVSALFMLLASLYDDRKDRSVLFWKSLPVTDYETVASKLVLALLIAPLVMVLAIVAAQIYLLAVGSLYLWSQDLGSPGRLWWHSGIPTGAFRLALGIFIQALWSLPVAGYLLLISATVSRLTLLWAVLVPVAVGILETIVLRTRVTSQFVSRHLEPAALPNLNGGDDRIMPVAHTVGDQLSLLASVDLWVGVLLGLGFLYAAARMREVKNEI